jgi:predicted nuclease of predicted toxin-antitoxin system
MVFKYLLDENVNPTYATQLRRQQPDLIVWVVGEPDTPVKSTLDPEILMWCEEHNFVLVTNNRASMPVHLRDHIAQGRHVPGIFILNPNLSIGRNIDELILIAQGSFEGEYQDQIIHLPLTKRRDEK